VGVEIYKDDKHSPGRPNWSDSGFNFSYKLVMCKFKERALQTDTKHKQRITLAVLNGKMKYMEIFSILFSFDKTIPNRE